MYVYIIQVSSINIVNIIFETLLLFHNYFSLYFPELVLDHRFTHMTFRHKQYTVYILFK